MKQKRLIELLAYAKVCFDHCTNPFETTHLVKKDVRSYECRDLSHEIADIIEKELYIWFTGHYDIKSILQQAEKEFAETQT
jgi:hypothetical protein